MDAEKWSERASSCEERGLSNLADTYRQMAEWARGERETVGPGLVEASEHREHGV